MLMLQVVATIVFGLAILVYIERKHASGVLGTELTRKIVHLVSGLALASWPFFVNWSTIVVLEVLFLVAVGLSRWLKIFGSQSAVNRLSWGEFFFPLGALLLIFLGAPRWLFVLAILHLALADAAAALVGVRYGSTNSYTVLGHKKSLAGSGAFLLVSASLMVGVYFLAPEYVSSYSLGLFIITPFITTIAENFGIYGTDNLLVPVTVLLLLS